jgi:hypothetical protein
MDMRWVAALLMVVSACGFPRPPALGEDAQQDADGAMADTSACFGSFLPVCFSAAPTALVALTDDTDIDTDASPICDRENDQKTRYCVVAGAGFTSTRRITAHGSKPLVLLSTTTIVLAGKLDVSSNHDGSQPRGAGANPLGLCTGPVPATGASGGFGGSFGTKGGDGQPLDGSSGVAASALASFPVSLRGGCPGGGGGPAGVGGAGGSGGGAVAIVAAEIRLDSEINASGAGGHGGRASKSGGGGGGSGGMIVLDSPSIVLGTSSALFANGGGGGQGGAGGSTPAAGPGDDGLESIGPDAPGQAGANGARDGGVGGMGGFSLHPGANAAGQATGDGGGGAGGGGVGFIRAHGVTGIKTISPPSNES